MIEHIDELPDGCIGVRAIGDFTIDDFNSVIAPDVDAIVERHERLRLVLELGEQFTGFGEGAWGELTGGLRHIKFHRGAVVTDDHHIAQVVNVLKWTLHGDVRTFHVREFDKATRWTAG